MRMDKVNPNTEEDKPSWEVLSDDIQENELKEVGEERPKKAGKLFTKHFARIQRYQKLRGEMNRDAVATLIVVEKLKPAEIAERLGLAQSTVYQHYKRAIADYGAGTLTKDDQVRLRAFVRASITKTIEEAMPLVQENAAYGALVIKGGEALLAMHGLDKIDGGEDGKISSPEEIAERVKVVSPLIAGRLQAAKKMAMKQVKTEALEVKES